MIPDEAEFTQPSRSSQLRSNPFWVAVFVAWIVMLIVGVTLALALGIWFLWQAF